MNPRLIFCSVPLVALVVTTVRGEPAVTATAVQPEMISLGAFDYVPTWPGYGAVPYAAYWRYWQLHGYSQPYSGGYNSYGGYNNGYGGGFNSYGHYGAAAGGQGGYTDYGGFHYMPQGAYIWPDGSGMTQYGGYHYRGFRGQGDGGRYGW